MSPALARPLLHALRRAALFAAALLAPAIFQQQAIYMQRIAQASAQAV